MVLSFFSRMCMCIEFVIQVLKQKNAHVSFPVGMVFLERPQGPNNCTRINLD